MQIIYFTLVGIAAYLAADWILNRIEIRRGKRFEYRSLIFFFLLLGIALAAFQAITYLVAPAVNS